MSDPEGHLVTGVNGKILPGLCRCSRNEAHRSWETTQRQDSRSRIAELRGRIAVRQGRDAYLAAMFGRFYEPGDPDDILPEIIAARCLGIRYGDPGPRFSPGRCRECWGDRQVWLGNCWGGQHVGAMTGCTHSCHENEVWLASTGEPALTAPDGHHE